MPPLGKVLSLPPSAIGILETTTTKTTTTATESDLRVRFRV